MPTTGALSLEIELGVVVHTDPFPGPLRPGVPTRSTRFHRIDVVVTHRRVRTPTTDERVPGPSLSRWLERRENLLRAANELVGVSFIIWRKHGQETPSSAGGDGEVMTIDLEVVHIELSLSVIHGTPVEENLIAPTESGESGGLLLELVEILLPDRLMLPDIYTGRIFDETSADDTVDRASEMSIFEPSLTLAKIDDFLELGGDDLLIGVTRAKLPEDVRVEVRLGRPSEVVPERAGTLFPGSGCSSVRTEPVALAHLEVVVEDLKRRLHD
jgi:hypothetical protein